VARLPIPGSDSGQWGTILNDYLAQAHDSSGTLKANSVGTSQIQGDAVTSTHVADGALPQAKVANLTTDLAAKISTTDARLSPDNNGIYAAQGYGFFTASEIPGLCDNPSSTSTDTLIGARVWVPSNKAINSVSVYVTIAGTLSGGGTNGFGIYTDGGVLVSSTTSDNNLWSSTGWRTATFSSAIAAQATGRFIFVCLLVVGYSGAPTILWNTMINSFMAEGSPGSSNKRSFFNGGGTTSFPASFNPVTIGTTNSSIPFFGLA